MAVWASVDDGRNHRARQNWQESKDRLWGRLRRAWPGTMSPCEGFASRYAPRHSKKIVHLLFKNPWSFEDCPVHVSSARARATQEREETLLANKPQNKHSQAMQRKESRPDILHNGHVQDAVATLASAGLRCGDRCLRT